jgi:ribosomal protein S18 acetylase RimI-like enzyme
MPHCQLRSDDIPRSHTLLTTLAPWVYEASNPFADWYFGDPGVAAELIAEWGERPDSEYYLGRALLLEDDESGAAAGCLIGMSGAELARSRRADFAAFCREIGSGPEADAIIDEVVAASQVLFPSVPDDAFYISRVVVDPRRRGQGLGRQLVQGTIWQRRAEGFRRFRLDVSADNGAAIRAYQAIGMQVVRTSHCEAADLTYHAMELGL